MSGRGMYGVEKKTKRPISRRKLVGVGIIMVILVGVLLVHNYGFPAKAFHLELKYPQNVARNSVFFGLELYDCTLNVSFVDDPDLVYRMDIELSDTAFASDAFEMTVSHSWRRGGGSVHISFNGVVYRATTTYVLVNEVRLVLGSANPYDIVVGGSNVNSTITYGNNAVGSDSYLGVHASGSFVSMTFTNSGMEVNIGTSGLERPDIKRNAIPLGEFT